MVTCVAYGCTNRTGKSSATFHRFPKNSKIRILWTKALRREGWEPTDYSRICSDHFREIDIDRTSLSCVRIREGAVPCIFPAFPSYLQSVPKQRRVLDKQMPQMTSNSSNEEDTQPLGSEEVLPDDVPLNADKSSRDIVACIKRKFDAVSEENMRYKKKIKLLHQTKRRLKKRIAGLKDIIKVLESKNYLEEESISVLKSVSGINDELLCRQFAKATGSVTPRKFGPALRSFALTLNFYSPKAYDYVRATFDTCLPHPRTLCKWYESVDGAPGFTSEAFEVVYFLSLPNCALKSPIKIFTCLSGMLFVTSSMSSQKSSISCGFFLLWSFVGACASIAVYVLLPDLKEVLELSSGIDLKSMMLSKSDLCTANPVPNNSGVPLLTAGFPL